MLTGLAVKERALELGFDLAGIAPIGISQELEFARRWVERGFHGEMRYLENPKRFDPRRVLPSARSAICVGMVYKSRIQDSGFGIQEEHDRKRIQDSGFGIQGKQSRSDEFPFSSFQFPVSSFQFPVSSQAPRACISRYAWGRDYHETMRAKLERLRAALEGMAPGVEARVFVDTGPVNEKALARFSGLGWMGKNTCILNQEKGSWFFLGVILASVELEPDLPAADRCGSCTACLEACPTGALVEPYVMDASRCISYFTIELRGSIPAAFRPQMGANLFGCDICQEVCPWNKSHQLSVVSSQFSLEALASIGEDDFRRLFAHSPIKRAKYRGWLRNLCVVMGNSGDLKFVPWLEEAAKHSDPVVREHAAWALGRLRAK